MNTIQILMFLLFTTCLPKASIMVLAEADSQPFSENNHVTTNLSSMDNSLPLASYSLDDTRRHCCPLLLTLFGRHWPPKDTSSSKQHNLAKSLVKVALKKVSFQSLTSSITVTMKAQSSLTQALKAQSSARKPKKSTKTSTKKARQAAKKATPLETDVEMLTTPTSSPPRVFLCGGSYGSHDGETTGTTG